MSIKLKKGGAINLTKKDPALKKIMIGLGWEMSSYQTLDLDASLFMVGANGKLPADEYFIFYNNLKSPDGSVQHTGDNRTGEGDGDDEMILANLDLIPEEIKELIVVVSIHEAETRRHRFGLLKEAYIRIVDMNRKSEVLIFDLDEEFPEATEMEFGRLQREDDGWHFIASGIGTKHGLQGYVDIYA